MARVLLSVCLRMKRALSETRLENKVFAVDARCFRGLKKAFVCSEEGIRLLQSK